MESTTALKSQLVQNQIREVGIDPNHWYPLIWSKQLKAGHVVPATVWQQSIALYRDANGQIQALENACPHKGVELAKGEVKGDRLVCPYHGWEFDAEGQCVHIPYLPPEQKLPCASARSYPVQEMYGIVWVFPGDPTLAASRSLPLVPEFSNPSSLLVPVLVDFDTHFSLCNENGMDVFHGFLHKDQVAWVNPVLTKLQATDSSVQAEYQVSYKGLLTKILGFGADSNGVTTRTAAIHYDYPHFHNTMEGVSSLYLMRLPVGPNTTRSFALLFLNQVRLPKWVLNTIKPLLVPFVQRLFMTLAVQDIEMMESERRTYELNPDRRYVEVNPAVIALQRVMIRQYEQFTQLAHQGFAQGLTKNLASPTTLSSISDGERTESAPQLSSLKEVRG